MLAWLKIHLPNGCSELDGSKHFMLKSSFIEAHTMKNRDTKIWKILAAIYMAYSITADIVLLMGLVWLIASGGI